MYRASEPLKMLPDMNAVWMVDRTDAVAAGLEIGRPTDTYRRVRIHSNFGNLVLLVTDGHLPYPYGGRRPDMRLRTSRVLSPRPAANVAILVALHTADQRSAALVPFPGGYIAEIRSPVSKQTASGARLGPLASKRASHVQGRPPDSPERWHASNTSEGT